MGRNLISGRRWFILVAGRYGQQVTHAHRLQVCAGLTRGIVCEKLQHLIVDAELSSRLLQFVNEHIHRVFAKARCRLKRGAHTACER